MEVGGRGQAILSYKVPIVTRQVWYRIGVLQGLPTSTYIVSLYPIPYYPSYPYLVYLPLSRYMDHLLPSKGIRLRHSYVDR